MSNAALIKAVYSLPHRLRAAGNFHVFRPDKLPHPALVIERCFPPGKTYETGPCRVCPALFLPCSTLYEDCGLRFNPITDLNKQFPTGTHMLSHCGNTPISKISPFPIRRWQMSLLSQPAGSSQIYRKRVYNQLKILKKKLTLIKRELTNQNELALF